jgi:hypothetical protein
MSRTSTDCQIRSVRSVQTDTGATRRPGQGRTDELKVSKSPHESKRTPEDDVRPVALVYFVEAVLSGGSREGAVLDADGAWVGTTWEVCSPYGSWGGQDERKERIAWRPPPVW